MNVLIACEESQEVCKAFRAKGHRAFSCDILECSGGHPEWHIQSDVLPLLNGNCFFTTSDEQTHEQQGKWDMIIAFPPCTHLAVSGAKHFEKKRADGRQAEAIKFFCRFLDADCDRIVIENPVGIISGTYITKWFPELAQKYRLPRKPSQTIHPWQFGHKCEKTTNLWIKGLPNLIPEINEKPEFEYWGNPQGTRRMEKWMYDIRCKPVTNGVRARLASKTFPGIAKAMAEQWG